MQKQGAHRRTRLLRTATCSDSLSSWRHLCLALTHIHSFVSLPRRLPTSFSLALSASVSNIRLACETFFIVDITCTYPNQVRLLEADNLHSSVEGCVSNRPYLRLIYTETLVGFVPKRRWSPVALECPTAKHRDTFQPTINLIKSCLLTQLN